MPAYWLLSMTHNPSWLSPSSFTKLSYLLVFFYTQPTFCVSLPVMGPFLNLLALLSPFLFTTFLLAILLKMPAWGPEEWILLVSLCHEKSKSYFSVSIRRLLLDVRGIGSQIKFQNMNASFWRTRDNSWISEEQQSRHVVTGRDLE